MKKFPLMIDLAGRLAVVVGGGPVGRRRAAGLSEAGARVRLVCLEPVGAPAESDDPATVQIIEPYRSDHLDGAFLVFAAAIPEVNARVVADARSLGILVNSADDPESGDFFVPGLVRRGDLHIAVSTNGAAPAVTRSVRAALEEQFDDAWAGWLNMQRQLRPLILETIADPAVRRRLFERLADLDGLGQFRSEGREAAFTAMLRVVEEARGR